MPRRELVTSWRIQMKGEQKVKRFVSSIKTMGSVLRKALSVPFKTLGFLAKGAGIATFVQGLAGAATFKAAKALGAIGGEVEALRVSLDNFLKGTGIDTNNFLADIERFAAKTPFKIQQTETAVRQLLAAGIAPGEILNDLKALGDTASATGGDFFRIASAFRDVKNAGKLTGEELRQFRNNAVPIFDALSATTGMTVSEINDAVRKGSISFEMVRESFRRLTGDGGRFENQMEKISNTIPGIASNISDEFSLLGRRIAEDVTPTFRVLLRGIQRFLGSQQAQRLAKVIGRIVTNLANAFKPVLGTLLNLLERLGDEAGEKGFFSGKTFQTIMKIAKSLFFLLNPLIFLVALINDLRKFLTGEEGGLFNRLFGDFRDNVKNKGFGTAIKDMITGAFFDAIDFINEKAGDIARRLSGLFNAITDGIIDSLVERLPFLKPLIEERKNKVDGGTLVPLSFADMELLKSGAFDQVMTPTINDPRSAFGQGPAMSTTSNKMEVNFNNSQNPQRDLKAARMDFERQQAERSNRTD